MTTPIAWLLMATLWPHHTTTVPGIATREECIRLGNYLALKSAIPDIFECVSYKIKS